MNIPWVIGLVVACVICASVGYYAGNSSGSPCPICEECKECGSSTSCPSCPKCPACPPPSCPTCPTSSGTCKTCLTYRDMVGTIPPQGGGTLADGQDSRAPDLLKVYVAPSGNGTVGDVYKFLFWVTEAYPFINHMRLEPGGGEGGATAFMKSGDIKAYGSDGGSLYTPTRKIQSM